ncbi:hypothetical protein [Tenacibaculum sp. Ill]|uniref:hypothetical protein n=1 Tax=Tenacibaculum sp. Ill TaxID=3445935 RepID=UPI003F7968F9
MLKNILNLGTILNKEEQKSINGGFAYTFWVEGYKYCVDCSRPITSEDNPTVDEMLKSDCRERRC